MIPDDIESIYVLFYKYRAKLETKYFWSVNTQAAIKRSMEHCRIQGYRYIYCWPLISDLDVDDATRKRNTEKEI